MDDNKKKFGGFSDEDEQGKAPRARNRTVMLTPEIAGEMRSHLKGGQTGGGTEEIAPAEIEQAKQNIARSSQPVFRPAGQSPSANRPSQSLMQNQRPSAQIPPVTPVVAKPAEPEERFDFEAELEEPAEIKTPSTPLFREPVREPAREPVRPVIAEQPARPLSRPVSIPPVAEIEIEEPAEEVIVPVAKPALRPPVASKIPEIDPSEDHIHWVKESKLCGFLVSYDRNSNGEVFYLRAGRLVISSEKAGTGNIFLIKDESVSPMHAILRIASGSDIQVLDQLSESGTKIERSDGEVVELSGDKTDLHHGDKVSFGDRSFIVCLIGV